MNDLTAAIDELIATTQLLEFCDAYLARAAIEELADTLAQ
jgi:hypothetical protein